MGEICNNLQVCPKDRVVSFFLQQSVLLADSMEFLPGLAWRLFTKIFSETVQSQKQWLGRICYREKEGGRWTQVPGHGYSALSPLQCSISSLGFYPAFWFHQLLASWFNLLTNCPWSVGPFLGWAAGLLSPPPQRLSFALSFPGRQMVQ